MTLPSSVYYMLRSAIRSESCIYRTISRPGITSNKTLSHCQRRSVVDMSTKDVAEAPPSSASVSINPSDLVMQLIVDEAILRQPEWSMGPMMAQAAHATSAILAQTFNEASTQAYLSESNLPNMRKIVLKTAKGVSLRDLSRKLDEARSTSPDTISAYHLWIEQPENIPTVLAIAPNARPAALKKVLNKCSLLRS